MSVLMDCKLGKGHPAGNMDQLAVLGEGKERRLSNAGGTSALQETQVP